MQHEDIPEDMEASNIHGLWAVIPAAALGD